MASKKSTKKKSATGASGAGGPGMHDDYYLKLRGWIERSSAGIDPDYRDYFLAVPDLFHLLCRLALDARVGSREKGLLGMAVVYVISPIDLIPDFMPLGFVDDLIVMVMVLDTVLGKVPKSIIDEHWAGTQDLYELIQTSVAKADEWVGKGLFRRIRSFLQNKGLWPAESGVGAVKKGASERTAGGGSPKRAAKKTTGGSTGRKTTSGKTAKRAAKKTAKKAAKKTTKSSGSKKAASASRRTIAARKKRPKGGSTGRDSS